MTNILIRNIDLERWKKVGRRVLVYGRRKVGKSFFIKNFAKWDRYFHVRRDKGIEDVENNREVSLDYLKDIIVEGNEKVVIDEFHRLGKSFVDFLHAHADKLNLILISSTLWFSKILLSRTPLLGIVEEFKMSIIDERDALIFSSERFSNKEKIIEASIYLREPILIDKLLKSEDIPDRMASILVENKNTIYGLVGEIFNEEEKELSSIYLATLIGIASGKRKSSEISSFLFSRRLTKKDDPSMIQSYLKTLCNVGILEKIPVLNKKFSLYYHISPLLDLALYLEGKYGYSELEIPKEYIKQVIKEKLPYHVEQFFFNLFSKLYGLKKVKINEPNLEVDIALTKFNKLYLIAEVKWKNKVSKEEIKEIIKKFDKVEEKYGKVKEKYIIVIDKKKVDCTLAKEEGIKVIDVNDVIKMVKERKENL